MPSQYRYGELGSVQMHSQFSYAMPCTPQAHCRYEPAVDLSYPSTLSPLSFQDTESWFPGTGFEATTTTTTMTGNGSSPEYNFQQPSELPLGSADDMRSSVDLWSPSMNCARAVPADIVTTLQGHDVKPTVNGVPNPVTVASGEVDLNAPAGTAVVVVPPRRKAAVPRPSSSTGALGKTKGTKAKGAKGGRSSGKSVSAPVSPSEMRRSSGKSTLPVQKTSSKKGHACKPGEAKLRVVSQRENHIWSERERRKGMNYLFNTLRSLLPHPVDKTDKSTVVGEIIKYIQSLQVKLEVMTTRQQVMMATRSSGFHSSSSGSTAVPKVLLSNGLTLVDHSSDPTSMTAVTALPPPGKESCLQSFLGTNVGIHVCGRNVFITTSSPRGRGGLFQELLVTIHKHELDIINATISTSTASVFHCLHCQASQDGELINHDLHSALQRVIANYGSQYYES